MKKKLLLICLLFATIGQAKDRINWTDYPTTFKVLAMGRGTAYSNFCWMHIHDGNMVYAVYDYPEESGGFIGSMAHTATCFSPDTVLPGRVRGSSIDLVIPHKGGPKAHRYRIKSVESLH